MYVQLVALIQSVGWFVFLCMVLFGFVCYMRGR